MKNGSIRYYNKKAKGRHERQFQKHLARIRAHESEWLIGEDGEGERKGRVRDTSPVESRYFKIYRQERLVGYKIDSGTPVYLRANGKCWYRSSRDIVYDNEKEIKKEELPPKALGLPVELGRSCKRKQT